ncbi:MAG TPA: protein translocase subunit SecD [Polyangiaceae bacterium]|nr:protein translocase subunit SecD [Polyangiaceae bacterium]
MIYVYAKYGLAALTLLFAFAAFAVKSRRGPLVWAALASLFAGLSAHYHVFWTFAVFSLMIPWALVTAGTILDTGWRLKAGFCVSLLFASGLCLYPSYLDERFGAWIDPNLPSEQIAAAETAAKAGDSGLPAFLRENVPFRLTRGLDLKGGFRVEYTVDVQEAIKDKRDRYYDDLRTALARDLGISKPDGTPSIEELNTLGQRVKIEKPRDDAGKIVLTFQNADDASKVNDAFLKKFVQELSVVREKDKNQVTFHIKPEVEAQVRKSAVDQAREKITRRVDTMGLKEANVAPREDDIVVEVPGQNRKQFEEIKEIVSQTARLEFKMLDDGSNFFKSVAEEWQTGKRTDVNEQGIRFVQEDVPLGQGKSQVSWFAAIDKKDGESMNDTLKRFKKWAEQFQAPDTNEISFGKMYDRTDGTEKGWRTYYLYSRAEVTGDMIRETQASPDQSGGGLGGWQVNLTFTPVGADRFEAVTAANIQRRFAIILDDKVESSPVIQGKIGGGSARITMGGGNAAQQMKDAQRLNLVLKSGALPAPIEYKGEQQVGPSLGADAIFSGLKGAGIGTALVLLAMIVIYSRAGFIANVAVLFNLLLQVAILAMFGASMSLPGIAGLSLTIGIAVDANVLINERIRDELRLGKSARSAVDVGYDRAFTAILDGHVTSLISGLILMQYGTGPIKGFANALIIGMLTSLFTGVLCTRLAFDWAVRWRKVKQLSLG